MTTTEIQDQVSMIKEVAEKGSQSKEYALQFLDDAGILDLIDNTSETENTQK
jgi:hypothetical protein